MISRKHILGLVEPTKRDKKLRGLFRVYDIVMIVAIIMTLCTLMFRRDTMLLISIDVCSCFIFVIDYILRWITADLRRGSHSRWCFVTYPFTPTAIFDMLAILTTFSLLNPAFERISLSRLMRLWRVTHFFRFFGPLRILTSVLKRERSVLLTVMSLALFYVIITAIIMFDGEHAINPDTGKPVFENFFDALYCATCTLTTVGYGDIHPVSYVGRTICMISSLVGVAIIALPSGVITAGYLEEIRKRNSKKEKSDE